MPAKTIACRLLDSLKIPYTVHAYEWDEEALDALTVAAKVGIAPHRIFKTLVLRADKTGVLLACLPGNRELDLKALASASGNKHVEMVPLKDVQSLTGYVRGGVSPLGMKKPYPVYMDLSVTDLEEVSISAGKRCLQIFLKGHDLLKATAAHVAAIARS